MKKLTETDPIKTDVLLLGKDIKLTAPTMLKGLKQTSDKELKENRRMPPQQQQKRITVNIEIIK